MARIAGILAKQNKDINNITKKKNEKDKIKHAVHSLVELSVMHSTTVARRVS